LVRLNGSEENGVQMWQAGGETGRKWCGSGNDTSPWEKDLLQAILSVGEGACR
jgi:hypothetical protein